MKIHTPIMLGSLIGATMSAVAVHANEPLIYVHNDFDQEAAVFLGLQPFIGPVLESDQKETYSTPIVKEEFEAPAMTIADTEFIPSVPFYSQFTDISDPNWKKIGCGITSLAMIIEHYNPGEVQVDALLSEGINAGAYLDNAGWIHQGLIDLAGHYGLVGQGHYYTNASKEVALHALATELSSGPVIASVHYTFDPQNPIPHLVVINGIDGNTVYYNDPSEDTGGGTISKDKFLKAWKNRYIALGPAA